MAKTKYWDIRPIKSINATYNIICGERSNGKTYGVLENEAIRKYFETGEQFAYVRRWGLEIKASMLKDLFSSIIYNGVISKYSTGVWNTVIYKSGAFYPAASDLEEKTIVSDEPMGYAFAISEMEHYKSLSYPGVTSIIFDEFISRNGYIPDEFMQFMNLISTIVRDRDNVKIWMLGNTVSKDCPYFREMGLKHVMNQEQGTIDTYQLDKGNSNTIIAVERTKNLAAKKSDKYFIFDNPKMKMITGGEWEMAIYPHLFEKYLPKQVMSVFFILYRGETLQCNIVDGESGQFIYIHQKTTDLRKPDDDLIYCTEPCCKPNWKVDITRPQYKIEHKIITLIQQERTCFQDNEVGEVFNDYLKWCRSHTAIKR